MSCLGNEIIKDYYGLSRLGQAQLLRHNNTHTHTPVNSSETADGCAFLHSQSKLTWAELSAAALSVQTGLDWDALWASWPRGIARGSSHCTASPAEIYGQIVKHFVTNAFAVIPPKSKNVTLMRNCTRWWNSGVSLERSYKSNGSWAKL